MQHQQYRAHLSSLNAYQRHKLLLHDLAVHYGAGQHDGQRSTTVVPKTDEQLLQEVYQFLPDPQAASDPSDWKTQLTHRYYARLYREYALADLHRYKEGKVGLRWRTKQEVVGGKGQFVCGSLGCEKREGLASFEVPFKYTENNTPKQALVKVRVCPRHAYKLNYKKLKELERSARKEAKRALKRAQYERKKRKREGVEDDEDEGVKEDGGGDEEEVDGEDNAAVDKLLDDLLQ